MTLVHVGIALRIAAETQTLRDMANNGGPTASNIARYVEFWPGDETWNPQRVTWGKLDKGVKIFRKGDARKLFELPGDATAEDVYALLDLPETATPPPPATAERAPAAMTPAVKFSLLPARALRIVDELVDYILDELSGPSQQTG